MSLGLGPIGDAVFSFGKSVVKNILGEFVSTTDAKNERGTGAEAAALAKIGFLDEKMVALQMAQAAEQRATRSRDPNEGNQSLVSMLDRLQRCILKLIGKTLMVLCHSR